MAWLGFLGYREDGDNSNENSDNDNNDDVDEAAEVDDEMKADEKIDDVGNASEDKSESQIILKDTMFGHVILGEIRN